MFLFSSDGRFASKFIATKPDTYEKRGIVPPDSAAGAVQILAIRRTQHGRPYARHHADNLAVALEIFVGHVRERPAKPKRNRREESRQRRRDERCYMAS